MTSVPRLLRLAVLSSVAAACYHAPPPPPPRDYGRETAELGARLAERIAASGATVALYFRDLNVADSLALGADVRYHAASTMKVAVMVQVFRDADEGRLRLDAPLTLANDFRSLVGNSRFTLDAKDDSDSSLYQRVGQPVTIRELTTRMITRSSNLATDNLIALVGAGRVQATLHALGVDSLQVLRGVEDDSAFAAGLNNTVTARSLGELLDAIADGRAAAARSCAEMLEILQRQRFNDAIPAGLPRGTRVAHKTGDITALFHDAALVYDKDRPRYILVVLTRGLRDMSESKQLIADLAAMVHRHVIPPPPPRLTPQGLRP
jgi:beta-lactamase class A